MRRDQATADKTKASPISGVSILVLVLSFLVVMIDGYDLLCISFAAPALARALEVDAASLGPIFSAGYAGVLIGGLTIGPLADRVGRKSVLLFCVTAFGLFSLAPVFDLSYERLFAYRFLTGLGLGGALPCVAALTADHAPARHRGMFVSIMYGGVAAGGVVGGFIASLLIPIHGWQAAFWIGGAAPLVLLPVLWLAMPEAAAFVSRRTHLSAGNNLIRERTMRGAGVGDIFRDGRAAGTLLLWFVTFCALFSFGIAVSWLPTILQRSGLGMSQAILGPVVLNFGGLLGTGVLALCFGAFGIPRTTVVGYALACLGAAAVGQLLEAPMPVLFALIFVSGFFVLGSINATNALAASFYPTAFRATGVGWALGAGRIGGVLGPAIGGLVLSSWPRGDIVLLLAACAAAAGAIAMAAFALIWRSSSTDSEPGPSGRLQEPTVVTS